MSPPRSHRHRLDHRLDDGRFGPDSAEALGQGLARHFSGAAREPVDASSLTPVALASRVREAVAELKEIAAAGDLARADLASIEALQAELLRGRIEAVLDRIEAGRIRRVPRRLGLDRVRLDDEGGIQLEASPSSFRDVAEPLACLCADLTANRAGHRAEQMLAAYALAADDYDLFRVIDFYERHQACRLAAQSIRQASQPGPGVRGYGLAALASGARFLLPPVVIATTGPVASGKSTVAHALALRIGAPRVMSDAVRDALLATPADWSEHQRHEALWQRAFAPDFEERAYSAVCRRAADVLGSGRPVVVDGCLATRERRAQVAELADRFEVPFWLVECQPDSEVLRRRWAERNLRDGCNGPAWETLAKNLADHWEPWSDTEAGSHIRLDTGRSIEECLSVAAKEIPGWPDSFPD